MSAINLTISVAQVSIEEVARHVGTVRVGVSFVISSVLETLLGAEGNIELGTGLEFNANVGGTGRCLDGAVVLDWT